MEPSYLCASVGWGFFCLLKYDVTVHTNRTILRGTGLARLMGLRQIQFWCAGEIPLDKDTFAPLHKGRLQLTL